MADKDELKGRKSASRSASLDSRIQDGGARGKTKTTQNNSNKKAKTGRAGKYKKGEMKNYTVTDDLPTNICCAGCNEEFNTDEVMLIECERCSGWHCITCAEMDKAEYDLMVKRKDLHWFCKGCEQQALSAVQVDMEIESRCSKYMESVNSKIEGIEKSLEAKCDQKIADELLERCKKLEEAVFASDKSPEPKIKNKIEESVVNAVKEQKDIELRKCNVIFHNLEESESEDVSVRVDFDKQKVLNICKDLEIDMNQNQILKINRLRKVKNSDKHRLLRVQFSNAMLKRSIIEKAPSIRDHVGKYGPVFIAPDLTKKQRALQKTLKDELNEKKENGEDGWTIKRWKVVKKAVGDTFRSSENKD